MERSRKDIFSGNEHKELGWTPDELLEKIIHEPNEEARAVLARQLSELRKAEHDNEIQELAKDVELLDPLGELVSQLEGEKRQEVIEHFASRLRTGRVGSLIKMLLVEPENRDRFYKLHEDREMFQDDDIDYKKDPSRITSVVVSLMRDTEMRQLFMDAALYDMNDKSEALSEAIGAVEREATQQERESVQVYDEVFIGGGVHASIYNVRRTMLNPAIKSLTIEASDVISSNFRSKGFVSINSENRPHTEDTPSHTLRRGNLNFFGKRAPVQLSYIEPEKFPSASALADVATANQYLSNSDILMNTRVKRIIKPENDPSSNTWPARYKIELEGVGVVYADSVKVATGLGEATFPEAFDSETIDLIKDTYETDTARGRAPGIMTYDQLAEYIHDSKRPFRDFVDKRISVVGGGDSAATAIEFFIRMSKKDIYKDDVMQAGQVKCINWIGVNASTRESYYDLLGNDRYAQIAQEMPNPEAKPGTEKKKIQPVNAYVSQVRMSDDIEKGRYIVTYTDKTDQTKEHHEYTDFVVITTGYKSRIGDVLGSEQDNPFKDPGEAEVVEGFFPDVKKSHPVAVRLKNQDIYAVGPMGIGEALVEGEIVHSGLEKVDIKKAERNFAVSIAVFGPRTEKLAEQESLKPRDKLLPRADLHRKHVQIGFKERGDSTKVVEWKRSDEVFPRLERPSSDLCAKVAFAESLEDIDFPDDFSEFRVTFQRLNNHDGGLRITVSCGVSETELNEFCYRLSQYGVQEAVYSIIGKGRQNTGEFAVNIIRGKASLPSLSFSRWHDDWEKSSTRKRGLTAGIES
jgi:hypothetical protein